MRKKNKLTGGIIFIENDLTWEERKVQKRIIVWAKEEKEIGKNVKISISKVKINGEWKYWSEI